MRPLEPLDFSVLPDVSSVHPELNAAEQRYAAHMAAREGALRSIFGETDPPNRVMVPPDASLTLNWAGGCVMRFPPRNGRTSWHFVTHGLAQPDDPDTPSSPDEPVSGFGIELVISTPTLAHWAPNVLLNLVRYLLFQPTAKVIFPGDRIPCNGPIVLGGTTALTHLLAVRSREYPSELLLPAGACTLVHLVGAAADEIERAQAWGPGNGGSLILERVFHHLGVGTVTDPSRSSIVPHPQFNLAWRQAQAELETQWRANGWNGHANSSSNAGA